MKRTKETETKHENSGERDRNGKSERDRKEAQISFHGETDKNRKELKRLKQNRNSIPWQNRQKEKNERD